MLFLKSMTPKRSWTLVETLVAVTIFSIIAAGLSTSFLSGMRIWARARNINLAQNELLIDIEKIGKELRQILRAPLIGCAGTVTEISFPNLQGNNIVKITYRFDPDKKMLLRSQADLKDILAEEKGGESESVSDNETGVLPLEEFALSYLYFNGETPRYTWTEVWNKDKGIFKAVKLRIKTKDEAIDKTIFIPVAD